MSEEFQQSHPRDRDRDRDRDRGPRYPPPFETHAADYILDPATGYFYEEWSDFFHDPKSKLYFHSGPKRYYTFDKREDEYIFVEEDYGRVKMKMPHDEKVDLVDVGNELIVQALQGGNKKINGAGAAAGKKKISIMIMQKPMGKGGVGGGKKLGKAVKKEATGTDGDKVKIQVVPKRKAHHDNMDKWSQRVKESDNQDEQTNGSSNQPSRPNPNSGGNIIKKTKSGKPICLLCKRKFASVEQLYQHESLSELHKYNLARLSDNTVSASVSVSVSCSKSMTYIDRAHNRRTMHESDQPPVPVMDAAEVKGIMAPSLDQARHVSVVHTVRPEDNLGASNIGNQMLQKLGWKGGALGRALAAGDEEGKQEGTNDKLKQDWERIESKAANSRRR